MPIIIFCNWRCTYSSEIRHASDLRQLREHIAAAFSSIAVINASFYSPKETPEGQVREYVPLLFFSTCFCHIDINMPCQGQGDTNSSELRVDLKQVI